MLFDTHAHYDDEKFDIDRDEVLSNLHTANIAYVLNAGTDFASSKSSVVLAEKYNFFYAAVGVHPHSANSVDDAVIASLIDLADNKKVVAIGEIGLDYYYNYSPKDTQQIVLSKQINLAKELKLPIILHDRDSHEDILKTIEKETAKTIGGVFHCFSGSVEMAKIVLDNNFYISIGGPITFKNAKKIIEVVRYVPLDRLLIETDSPYLAPEPNRGTRNDSRNLTYIVQKIAEIKELDFSEVATQTTKNAKDVFRISNTL